MHGWDSGAITIATFQAGLAERICGVSFQLARILESLNSASWKLTPLFELLGNGLKSVLHYLRFFPSCTSGVALAASGLFVQLPQLLT